MENYVYHITPKSNEESIDKNGLIINHNQTNHDYYTEKQIFLGFNPNDCIELVSDMIEDNIKPEEDLVLYRIPIDKLDLDEIGYDFNMKLDDYDDIISFTYNKDIDPSVIEKVTTIPMYQDYDVEDYLTLEEMRKGLYGEIALDIANKLIDIYEDNFSDIDKEMEEETDNYLYELEQYEKENEKVEYIAEVGVLLNKDNEEFENYSIKDVSKDYAFYDEDRTTFTLLNEAEEYIKNYAKDGVDNTYGFVIPKEVENDFSLSDILFSVAKLNGEVEHNFLGNDVLLEVVSNDRENKNDNKVNIIDSYDLLSDDIKKEYSDFCKSLVDENRKVPTDNHDPLSRYLNDEIQKELSIEGVVMFNDAKATTQLHFSLFSYDVNRLSSFSAYGKDCENVPLIKKCLQKMYDNVGHYNDKDAKNIADLNSIRGFSVDDVKKEMNNKDFIK